LGYLFLGKRNSTHSGGLQAIFGHPLAPLSIGHSPHTKGYEGSNRLARLLWNRQRRSIPQRIRTAMESVPPAPLPTTRRPPRLLPPTPRVAHPRISSSLGQAFTQHASHCVERPTVRTGYKLHIVGPWNDSVRRTRRRLVYIAPFRAAHREPSRSLASPVMTKAPAQQLAKFQPIEVPRS